MKIYKEAEFCYSLGRSCRRCGIGAKISRATFSKEFFNDGYKRSISLYKGLDGELSFEDFKQEVMERKEEFTYTYRTDKVDYGYLRDFTHIYFRTPYFPDKWREIAGKI